MKIFKKTGRIFLLATFFFWLFSFIGTEPVLAECVMRSRDCGGTAYKTCSGDGDCGGCAGPSDGVNWCCYNYCEQGSWCRGDRWRCDSGEQPSCCSGGCFSSGTKVRTPEGEREIRDLQVGDEIKSFSLKNKQEVASLVEKIYEVTRSAYYRIKTKGGKELKVTGEHPLYAVQKGVVPLSFREYLKTESLTKRILDFLLK